MKKRKVIIADNNKYFRQGLKQVLQNIGNVEVVAEVSNGFSLLNALENSRADIVFTDLEIPIVNGLELIKLGNIKYPETSFIALSSLENNRYIEEVISVGASGYLYKSGDNYEVFQDILINPKQRLFFTPGNVQKEYSLTLNDK